MWLVGVLGRGLWTPDEPREADIAWRMSQHPAALPQLAGRPFLEKPPLTYWFSGAGIALWGDSARAARAPNLLYGALEAACVVLLVLELGGGARAALLAGLCGSSMLLQWRVSSWLAPDAALLAGNALALLGMWRGYRASAGGAKLRGYTLMHLGAAIGFMAKSAPGWLVPGLALLALIVWERRWEELRRYELYAGAILQALLIGPWIVAVSGGPEAAGSLRTLLWHNTVGRFAPVAAPAALDYTSGHRNWPGKYLLELPLYLLPWSLLALAAAKRAWQQVRHSSAWRFAVCAAVPWLALLSLAATARDVYAAPALLGAALLIGLWVRSLAEQACVFDAVCVRVTCLLMGLIALGVIAALIVLGVVGVAPRSAAFVTALIIALICAPLLAQAARTARHTLARAIVLLYAAHALTVTLGALLIMPAIDVAQDLGGLAQRVRADTSGQPLALLDPDETTLAILDHGAASAPVMLGPAAGAAEVRHWFADEPASARVLVLLPGHAPGPISARLGGPASAGDGAAAVLQRAGAARLVRRYELPEGRRYALLGPLSTSTREPSHDSN
ncbi:MAG: glycosyltransferase family 39 protein [Gammaproteobacteria bacterium]|nr:glycosyltransferase family 39 protein [Gammaproteobacteria bacterium]